MKQRQCWCHLKVFALPDRQFHTCPSTPPKLPAAGRCAWFDRDNSTSITPTSNEYDVNTCAGCVAACEPHPNCYFYTWNGSRRFSYNDNASPCS